MNTAQLSTPVRTSVLPLYQQIKDDIRMRIRSSDWQPGTRLPSENDMVHALGVSRMTVHRALRELTQEGLLDRVHGLGTFVAKPARHASLITLRDIADELRSAGLSHQSRTLSLKRVVATQRQANLMEIRTGQPLFHLRAIHLQDQQPIQLEDRLVNPAVAPAFLDQDFSQRTATAYLIELVKPEEMEHIVTAVLPDRRSARALQIETTQPCLQLTRRTWNAGKVVTGVSLTYPGNRYDLAARYQTDQFNPR